MGRPRKTTAEHRRDGTSRADRHGEQFAAAGAFAPNRPPIAPNGLDGAALELWELLVEELEGVVGPLDGPSLALLCTTYAELLRAARKLAELEPDSTEYARLSRSIRGHNETYLKLAALFGLSPSDREKLPVPDTGEVAGVVHW